MLHENRLSWKFIFLSTDCKFRACESFKSHPAPKGSLPDTDVRQLPICIHNQCASTADVPLGERNTGSDHLCDSFPGSASPGCGSPAAHTDLSSCCCRPAPFAPLPGTPLILSKPYQETKQQKTIFSMMSVFSPFRLSEAACQRLLQCQQRGRAGRQAEHSRSIAGCYGGENQRRNKATRGQCTCIATTKHFIVTTSHSILAR